MESSVRPDKTRSRWLKAVPLGLALLLLLGRSAGAQTASLFEVGVDAGGADPLDNYYTQIYATNFVNGVSQYSQFSFNNYTGSPNWLGALYHNWYNTLNFTNIGEMDSVTGFYFDTQPYPYANDRAAASFYNAGSISCGASTNAIFLNQFFNSISGVYYGGYGGINVWATNIFSGNNSAIIVGSDGLARFGGNNVVFSNTTVTIQTSSGIMSGISSASTVANVSASGQADYNTNFWNPSQTLTALSASAPLNSLPFEIYLFNNPVPYYQQVGNGSNVTVRMIFLQDTSANVTTNVYISPNDIFGGEGTVEWVGTYTNPATGQAATRYLYLNDNYAASASTNILKYGDPGTGVPANFTILASSTQLAGLGVPQTTNFYSGLDPTNSFTNNIYSYVAAQMIPSSVAINGVGTSAIALTNLPGRIEITASNELNLSKASFSGMNYLRLNSPNQFDYDGRDQVSAPYADFYLGSTNGSMAITNLIEPILPVWSGSLQAFSTRWTNVVGGINYDYRVMLVKSQLTPVTSSAVQDFVLYSSNNVVISDILNITRTFSLNCTNLLLTTNGTGAASPDGELNLGPAVAKWQSAVSRLRCLTNNGAIRMSSSPANFGSLSSPYLALVNTGLITNGGNIFVFSGDLENYGTIAAGAGSFTAQTLTTTMTNATLLATTPVSLAASNMVITGTSIQSGNSLTLIATNLLTDGGVNSSNFWSLGANDTSFGNPPGLELPIKPAYGDLLGTTITNLAPVANAVVYNTWAGQDRGYSTAGYQNNAAIGQLVLDAQTNTAVFNFAGTSTDGSTNAIYVDCLVLKDYVGSSYANNGSLPALTFANNLVIYYAQAIDAGGSVAEYINHFNNDHLRWASNYVGHYSSTNITYPDGRTYAVNAALANAPDIDSDRDGINNNADPTPFLVPPELNFTVAVTNYPPLSAKIGWRTIPLAGNYVYYSTNLASTNWLPFTNFISPQPYDDGLGIHPDNGEMTNVWVLDPLTNAARFYRIMVQPN